MELIRDGNKPNGESYFCRTFTGLASYNNTDKFKKYHLKILKIQKNISKSI